MGVMNCSRKNCENIMCNTYISDIGYVCNNCQQEFKGIMELEYSNTTPTFSEDWIIDKLKKFMVTTKNGHTGNMSIEEFFSM